MNSSNIGFTGRLNRVGPTARTALLAVLAGLSVTTSVNANSAVHDADFHESPTRQNDRESPDAAALKAILNNTLQRTGLPAIAAAVITTDQIETYDTGVRRAGAPAMVRRDDLWHLGSLEKSMTATMIARLVEAGKLRWDTTIGEVLPEVLATARAEYRSVTLDQLLRHRGGIVQLESFTDIVALPPFTGTPTQQRVQLATYGLSLPPVATPGLGFAYSNGGYAIAAAMAERVTGVPYEKLMTRLLFAPLAVDAKFNWPTVGDPHQPWGHQDLGAGTIEPIDLTDPRFAFPKLVEPAGNISLAIGDLARYVQLHLRGLRGEGRLLDMSTFHHLHEPTFRVGDPFPYASGWVRLAVNGVPTSYHDGSAIGFYAVMYLQPSRNRAVVMATNQFDQVSVDTLNAAAVQLLRSP
jgi:CubicO group peptidase (beta-lactamase class C family)